MTLTLLHSEQPKLNRCKRVNPIFQKLFMPKPTIKILKTWAPKTVAKISQNGIAVCLTLLHSKQPKLYGVLAVLSATGLKEH